MEIRETVEDMPSSALSLSDWKVYDEILERILSSFTEGFDHANPDTASNYSRDKIAHGHVTDVETEANSLKRFLYLNEIFGLFTMLDTVLLELDKQHDNEN